MHKCLMNLGIIGYRNHSQKIIDLVAKNKNIKNINVFSYKKKPNITNISQSSKVKIVFYLNELNNSDAIIIASPAKTHKKYLNYFIKKNKYIFCEKPACNSKKDYIFLKNLNSKNKKKIHINYNLLFSRYYKIINSIIKNKKKYGKIIYLDIKLTNGISFKKKIQNNWRFKSKNIFEQIAGNLGVHYVNLFISLFGDIFKKNIYKLSNNKKNDSALLVLKSKSNKLASFYFSYSSPLTDEIDIYLTNAVIKINDNKAILIHPRDTFDKKGYFINPRHSTLHNFRQSTEYEDSIKNSLNFFIKKVKSKSAFSLTQYNNALKTLKFFL